MAKQVNKPPHHISLVKSTKYMTEESEHYMDLPKVHKSPATSLDPEPDTQDKQITRPGPP
jgi:hypothetical protein